MTSPDHDQHDDQHDDQQHDQHDDQHESSTGGAGTSRVGVRRVVVAAASLVVVLVAAVSSWAGIRASHPAYLLVLVVIVLVAVTVLSVWGGRAWEGRAVPRGPRSVRTTVRTLLAGTALVVVIAVVMYFRPLTASPSAVAQLVDDADVEVTESLTSIEFAPSAGATTGLVFYPGALVDPRAYAPTLRPLAEAGYLVVVVKMPMGVAFFGAGAASDVIADHPTIEHWAVGGHSLGGAVASIYARDHRGEGGVDGLVLWAAYPTGPMADAADLAVVSVSAANDGLATPDDIAASVADLPATAEFVTVPGAVHAFFGDYGDQRGDGDPTVSRQDAQAQIVEATSTFLASLPARHTASDE
ncbi:MAG: alpha/beta hydrolase [Actinobacteria bacterium]|nr:alpha/beta hydrolase [Actinomycetota bacterium]